MKGTRASRAILASRSASISAWASSSMAQGPPMRGSGLFPPILIFPTTTSRVMGARASAGAGALDGGLDERREERVGFPRPRSELRVELAGDEPGMVGQLDDLHELLLGPESGDVEAVFLEVLEVVVVHLVPMPVSLLDDPLPVGLGRGAPLREHDRVEAEPHRPALVLDRPLLGQEINDLVGGVGVEL